MKQHFYSIWFSAVLCAPCIAAPLAPSAIPESAKWVAHLDLDRLQETQLGKVLAKQFLDPMVGQFAAMAQTQLGLDVDWRKIQGITAYGTQLKKKPESHAVVLIQSELPLRDALATAMEKLGKAPVDSEKPAALQKIEDGGQVLYALGKDGYASLTDKNLLVLGKSRRAVSNALVQLQRTGAAPVASTGPSSPAKTSGTFLQLKLTEQFHEGLDLPAPAQVLKQTEGIELSLGESSDHLQALLALQAKTSDVVQQLHQALQGVVAMGSLALNDKPELQKWIQGIQVDRQDREIDLALKLPLSDVFNLIESKKPKKTARKE